MGGSWVAQHELRDAFNQLMATQPQFFMFGERGQSAFRRAASAKRDVRRLIRIKPLNRQLPRFAILRLQRSELPWT
jgi:hypothetical protein